MSEYAAIEELVAESLANSLSQVLWSGSVSSFTAKMQYVPDYEVADLATLRVSVVPGDLDISLFEGRGGDLHEPHVHIVMAKRFANDAEVRDLIKLRTQIQDKVRSGTLPASTPAMPSGVQWWGMQVSSTFDRDQLSASRVFLADIEVSYRILLGREG
jgi:hypothetical protein